MYKIIGADQKEYGPVTSDQIRQWIADRRVNAQTQARAEGAEEWKTLAAFPEFAGAFGVTSTVPPLPTARPPAVPKPSGMAITSLVLGILGLFTCGIAAVAGLVLGIISMSNIRKSDGQMGGWGIALAGTIVSAAFLLLAPLCAAMMLPALAKAKQRAQTIQCVSNVRQLAMAVKMYSVDNEGQFPSVANWCDTIQREVGTEKVFSCPAADRGQRCHYAFNAKLSGLYETNVPPDTVLLFETSGGWNLSGGPELMLSRSRHGRQFVVGFADGSVQQLDALGVKQLRWDP